jgi:hypothetical protein
MYKLTKILNEIKIKPKNKLFLGKKYEIEKFLYVYAGQKAQKVNNDNVVIHVFKPAVADRDVYGQHFPRFLTAKQVENGFKEGWIKQID